MQRDSDSSLFKPTIHQIQAINSEQGLSKDEAQIRLKDLDFTDLFCSEQGESFFRGYGDDEGDSVSRKLVAVPDFVMDDIEKVHRTVCNLGQNQREFFLDYDTMRFRVSRIDDVMETWFTLRRTMWPLPRFGKLAGIPPRITQYLGHLGKRGREGLILFAGATGDGKTTTTCSLLQEYLIHFGDVAVTIEDPPELPMSGWYGTSGRCFQTKVKDGDFGTALRNSMRYSPRYILVGEIRGPEEASKALSLAQSGHIVLATIHAADAPKGLAALLKYLPASDDLEQARSILADSLLGVIHQRLIKVPGKRGKKLSLQCLFPGQGQQVRSIIRAGKFHQLGTAISQQEMRVLQGKMPVEG